VRLMALLNLGYFGAEVAVAIGSVSLFADSIDFLECSANRLLDCVRRFARYSMPSSRRI
jgi:Co/Zn/Cd efflux system component